MSAREKMKKAERVPLEMLSRWNAARADFLQTKAEADARIKAFVDQCQKAVNEAGMAMAKVDGEIVNALGLDPKADMFTSAGVVKRGGKLEAAK